MRLTFINKKASKSKPFLLLIYCIISGIGVKFIMFALNYEEFTAMSMRENAVKYPVTEKHNYILKTLHTNNNVYIYYTFVSLLLKSFIFLGFTATDTALNIDLLNVIYSHPSLTAFLSFIALFLSFAFLFKNCQRLWYLALLNLTVSILFMIDIWYYRGFGSFTSVHLFNQTANLDNMSDSIISFVHFIDFIFLVDIFILIFAIFKFTRLNKQNARNVRAFAAVFMLSVAYMIFTHLWVDVLGKGNGRHFFPKERSYSPRWSMMMLSPIGYHIYDAYLYWKDSKPFFLSSEEKQEIQEWYRQKQETLPDNEYKGIFKGKNLIFIQVESLEKFIINRKINNQEISPNLNKLIKSSLYFDNFYEQVNDGTSSDADLLVNTSVYPLLQGSTFFRYPNNTYNSLPKLLTDKGYYTLAAHPDKGVFWNWMSALYSIGFDTCIDSSHFVKDEIIGLGLSDGSYLRQMVPVVKGLKQPFYTFLVTMTNHGPFNLPDSHRELVLDTSLNSTKLGGYFQSIYYTDKQIGNFISALDKEGILDKAVIVIYGDHTGVHKYYNDELLKITPREDWWMEGQNQIPFIIYSKDIKAEQISVNGGHIDIMPTIAYLMGIDENEISNTAMGRNLLKTSKSFAVLSGGRYIGDSINKSEQESSLKGLEIADKMLRSNYFKELSGGQN